MNGKQFINMIQAYNNNKEVPISITQRIKALKTLKANYFYGELVESKISHTISAKCKKGKNRVGSSFYICMKCGRKMYNRGNQYLKNSKWVNKKHKDNQNHWSCFACFPKGHAPLVVSACVIKE